MFKFIIDWFKPKQKHTFLTKEEVHDIESLINLYWSDGSIQRKYPVSKTTIYRIRKGNHRFSTEVQHEDNS